MIRIFGAAQYTEVMRWPPRLIYRAAAIEQERQAGRRADAVLDASIAAGLKLGQEYVDPKAKPRKPDEPYYSLKPYEVHLAELERRAAPWRVKVETAEEKAARLDREQDEAFARMFAELRSAQA